MVADHLRRREPVAAQSQAVVVVIALRAGLPPGHLTPGTAAHQPAAGERPQERGQVGGRADQPAAGPVDRRIHAGDVLPLELMRRDVVAAGWLVAALQPGVGHAGRVQHQLPVGRLQRPACQRLDDEPGEQEAGVGVGAGRAWGRGRRLPGHRQLDQISRPEPAPTTALSDRLLDRGLGEEVRESAGVVQELPQGDGGSVGASRAVVEPVDDLAGEVLAGRVIQPAVALIGQH